MKFFGKTVLGTIIFGSILFLFFTSGLKNMGNFLAVDENFQKVDVIVVLSGGGNERIEKGVELYKEGLAPLLLVSGATQDGSTSNAETMYWYAVRNEVDPSHILREPMARSTFENALFSLELFETPPSTLLLVTSEYHQKRAYEIFKRIFSDTQIFNASADVDFWTPDQWWENEKSLALTLSEWGKILVGRLFGIWG